MAELFASLIAIGIYFLPTIIAVCKGSDVAGPVFLTNLLFGWLVVPWIIAAYMALAD